jgi:hypothetical protein
VAESGAGRPASQLRNTADFLAVGMRDNEDAAIRRRYQNKGVVIIMLIAKRFAVGFGLAVALPLLINLGVSTFSKAPVYSDYHHNIACCDARSPVQQQQFDKDQAAFDRAQTLYEDRMFAVAVPIGLVALFIGSLIAASAVGPGLMFGGIFSVIEGYGFCWDKLPEPVRFASLLVAFALLIYIGIRKIDPLRPEVARSVT